MRPNNRLKADLGGFSPRIRTINITKLVLIPKVDLVPPPSSLAGALGGMRLLQVNENQYMTFESYDENAQTIFESFPNEQVWFQGGLKPNRQLHRPEGGYCVVIRYDEKTTRSILDFMAKVRSVLPHYVEYSEQNLHTTIGTYGKGNMEEFIPDSAILSYLAKSIEKGISNYSKDICVEFGKWLYNDEAILVSGRPNRSLWCFFQNIGNACQEQGYPLEMGRITHLTTARFMSDVTFREFERFSLLMKSAPIIEPSKPNAVELATWCCDGKKFDLFTHRHYCI